MFLDIAVFFHLTCSQYHIRMLWCGTGLYRTCCWSNSCISL